MPVALTLSGWVGISLLIAGLTYGITIFVVAYALTQLDWLNTMQRDSGGAAADKGFPRICWIGIACVPAFFVGLAMFDRGVEAGWSYALVGAILAICTAAWSVGLLSERRRRKSVRKLGVFQFASVFMLAIASRTRATGARQEEIRRRVAFQLESLLTLVAFGVVAFAWILSFLLVHRYGVDLTGGPYSDTTAKRAASAYVAWHTLDLVPLLDIPKTLHSRLERTLADSWTTTTLLLTLKLFILVPVLRTAVTIWDLRSAGTSNGSPP